MLKETKIVGTRCATFLCAALFTPLAHSQCETQVIEGLFGLGHEMHTDGEVAAFAQGVQVDMKVHVYRRQGSLFVHEETIDIPHNDTIQQNIIFAVHVAGDWLVAGDDAIGPGRFLIYRRIDDAWTHVQTVTSPPGSGPDFSQSAAIDGTRMLLAVNGWAGVFELEADKWVHQADLPNPDEDTQPWPGAYGWSAALSGDRAVIGAIWAGELQGRVYVFDRVEGEWTHTHSHAPDPIEGGSELGWSVAIAGDLVLGFAARQQRLYAFGPRNSVASIEAGGLPTTPAATFGFSMSANKEGTRAIVGGGHCEDGNAVAYLFSIVDGIVQFDKKLVGTGCADYAWLGWSTTINGNFAMMSADFFGVPGLVHVFSGVTDDSVCVDCPADLTGSGSVGVPDLLALLGAWGTCSNPSICPADLTGSGSVGVPDLLVLLGSWGDCS